MSRLYKISDIMYVPHIPEICFISEFSVAYIVEQGAVYTEEEKLTTKVRTLLWGGSPLTRVGFFALRSPDTGDSS
jgi:hypothetical protein